MRKPELVARVAEVADLNRRQADDAVAAVLEHLTNALSRGENISLVGFGAFAVRERAARAGRNPRTGEPMTLPASRQVVFRPGKTLKQAVEPHNR